MESRSGDPARHSRLGGTGPTVARGALAALAASLLLAGCSEDAPTGAGASGTSDAMAPSAYIDSLSSAYESLSIDAIRADPGALETAAMLFANRCASCHGSDGRGKRDIPDLTRGRFSYGTSAEDVRTTIRDGRYSLMPAMGSRYGEVDLGEIVSYLESLSSDEPLTAHEVRGQSFFEESCASCHGEDGRGQPALGAPDLTDDYWDHGDSMMNIRLAITRGTESACPAQGESLTPTQIDLLTAYTLELAGL
ncbi:MAG: c-type cytochrome [Gammaproteobacteria bacterium]